MLEYSSFKNWFLRDILKQYMKTDHPSYFGLFSEIILFSNEQLNKLEKSDSFKEVNCTILILKNEKLAFISMLRIQSENIVSSSCFLFENKEKIDQIPLKSVIKVEKTELTQTMFREAEKKIQEKV